MENCTAMSKRVILNDEKENTLTDYHIISFGYADFWLNRKTIKNRYTTKKTGKNRLFGCFLLS